MITRYEPALSLWKATNKEQRDFLATSNAPEISLLVGVHNWTIYNDSKLCSLDSSYTTVLKMIGCSQKEFTCNNGICVDMATRCDGMNDCADESDEAGCKSFVQSTGYDRFKVPPPMQGGRSWQAFGGGQKNAIDSFVNHVFANSRQKKRCFFAFN